MNGPSAIKRAAHPVDTPVMDHPALLAESDLRRRLPLAMVGGLCALLAFLWVLASGLYGVSLTAAPALVIAGLAVALTLLDLRIGLGLIIFSAGISPEFLVGGIANLRLEDFLFPLLLLAWLFQAAARNERFAPTDLKLPILLTVLVSAVSTLENSVYSRLDLVSGAFRLGKSFQYFLLFTVTLNVLRRKEDLRAFAYLMPLLASAVGLYGIFQSLQSQGRVTGPPGETSNILGGYLALHVCLAVGLLSSGARGRPALCVSFLLCLVPLVLTMSRSSSIALLAGLLVMFALHRNPWTGAVLFGSLFLYFASMVFLERYRTIFEVFRGDAPNSLVMRVRGWLVFLEYLPDTPLLGQGVGNKSLGAFDNEYVRQSFELGVLGLGVFLWMQARILRKARRLARGPGDPVFRGFALGLFGGTTALLVHALGATTFSTIRTAEPFYLAVGILYAIALHLEGRPGHRDGEEEDLPRELPAAPPWEAPRGPSGGLLSGRRGLRASPGPGAPR